MVVFALCFLSQALWSLLFLWTIEMSVNDENEDGRAFHPLSQTNGWRADCGCARSPFYRRPNDPWKSNAHSEKTSRFLPLVTIDVRMNAGKMGRHLLRSAKDGRTSFALCKRWEDIFCALQKMGGHLLRSAKKEESNDRCLYERWPFSEQNGLENETIVLDCAIGAFSFFLSLTNALTHTRTHTHTHAHTHTHTHTCLYKNSHVKRRFWTHRQTFVSVRSGDMKPCPRSKFAPHIEDGSGAKRAQERPTNQQIRSILVI